MKEDLGSHAKEAIYYTKSEDHGHTINETRSDLSVASDVIVSEGHAD